MIRNIITATILLAALVSMATIGQVANAVEPDLNLEISAYENNLSDGVNNSFTHPFSWTPNLSQQEKIIKLYERLFLPNSVNLTGFTENTNKGADQRLLSFEVYQGDGLDDLRQMSKHHNINLPDEDTEAYGVSVKQRF
ncbi:MAG: hypothetical protein P8X88_00535 [Gammaproteobacteria bacterium]